MIAALVKLVKLAVRDELERAFEFEHGRREWILADLREKNAAEARRLVRRMIRHRIRRPRFGSTVEV